MTEKFITFKVTRTQKVDWKLRIKLPDGELTNSIIVLLHGWSGDERSMDIFTPRLPKNSIVISLRGLYPASGGGYGWVEKGVQSWPALKDFIHGVEALIELLDPENIPLRLIDRDCLNRINFIGFSQGAAMIYAFSLLHPERIQSISGLSGFLPDGTEAYIQKRVLSGKSVFVAHGTEDYLVPIDRARKSIELLKAAGGRVTYCEDNVGHKLSLNCFKGLELFLQRNICKPH